MSRYSLTSLSGGKQVEYFGQRRKNKILEILNHPRNHMAGNVVSYDEDDRFTDRFEIYDAYQTKLFSGNIQDTIYFVENSLK